MAEMGLMVFNILDWRMHQDRSGLLSWCEQSDTPIKEERYRPDDLRT